MINKRFAVISIAALTVAATLALPASQLFAQDATAPATDAATSTTQPSTGAPATAPSADLKSDVETFWHYGKIARYELATAQGQKILDMHPDPLATLSAFEQVAAARQDNLDQWLLRWQNVPQTKDVTTKLIGVIGEGYRARRASSDFIAEQIGRLSTNERAYELAIGRLRESGELAVPYLVDILRDPTKKEMIPTVRRALRDLGRPTLNPLVAATEMKDNDTLAVVVDVLGDLGYDAAAPYLARLLESKDAPASVKTAASEALSKLGVSSVGSMPASDLFYNLAEKFYYETSAIAADSRYPTANIWMWNSDRGLTRVEVPPVIFNEIMSMRACEYTLKLGGAHTDDALSLWLASNFKREAELPQGATDATRPEGYPPGHYWGVEAGAHYLEAALSRAIHDHNAAVSYRAIRSLQEIVGRSNINSGGGTAQPLIAATQYPDRKVRIEAAFALAAAMPEKNFEGSQRVVPLLGEALAQTGSTGVLVVAPNQDQVNGLVEALKAQGYNAIGATSAEGAAAAAVGVPAVDVIVVNEDLGPGNVDQLFLAASENARLAGAARLVITKTNASIYEPRKVNDALLSTTTATDPAALKPAIEEARSKAGALPIDPNVATEYATRAAILMIRIGSARESIYDLGAGKQPLLAALNDARPDIVKLSGQALACVNDREAQLGLLMAASNEKATDDVKISLYRSLASSAKLSGNLLDSGSLDTLSKTVAGAKNLDVRSAAAEARGALNLPADQAKSLVVDQSRV